jgi:hypothetical protein
MTRNPVRPTSRRGLPVRGNKRTHRDSTSVDIEELQQIDTSDSVDGVVGENTRTVLLSAYDRMVLSCLAGNGGKLRIFRLAYAVATSLDGRNTDTTADVQRTFLTVRSIIEDLAEKGLVTYSERHGTVQLA